MTFDFSAYKKLVKTATYVGVIVGISFVLNQCSTKKQNPRVNDTPTSGEIVIVADEAYQTILEDQKFLFEIKYPKSQLKIFYTNEDDALNALVSDSVRLGIVSCEPGARELSFFKSKGITHHVNHIANDAVVLVTNKNFPLNKLSKNQLQQLFSGEIHSMAGLTQNNTNAQEKLILGFNQKGSGIINYFRKYFLHKNQKFPANSGVFKNNFQLLDTVKKYPNIIGFIGYNLISDKDDSLTKYIKSNFKILSLESLKDTAQFVLPSQSSIADSAYPLIRKIYVINREGKSGLGTGFVIFMQSFKGQRVMLKAGLIPATMPGREVRFIKRKVKL